jgi:hypothetical protein
MHPTTQSSRVCFSPVLFVSRPCSSLPSPSIDDAARDDPHTLPTAPHIPLSILHVFCVSSTYTKTVGSRWLTVAARRLLRSTKAAHKENTQAHKHTSTRRENNLTTFIPEAVRPVLGHPHCIGQLGQPFSHSVTRSLVLSPWCSCAGRPPALVALLSFLMPLSYFLLSIGCQPIYGDEWLASLGLDVGRSHFWFAPDCVLHTQFCFCRAQPTKHPRKQADVDTGQSTACTICCPPPFREITRALSFFSSFSSYSSPHVVFPRSVPNRNANFVVEVQNQSRAKAMCMQGPA